MRVIGICDGHDAGACLVDDGVVVRAVSEERLTRRKRQPGFPARSVEMCLRAAEVDPREIDRVAVAGVSGRAAFRALDRWYRKTNPDLPLDRPANQLSTFAQNAVPRIPLIREADARLSRRCLGRRLSRMGITGELRVIDHHRAHAEAAARAGGFGDALVLTQDAHGDGVSGTASRWRGGALTRLQTIAYPHSPALLYGLVTAHLGFDEGDEGKVAGLAATGDPERGASALSDLFDVRNGRIRLRYALRPDRLRRRLAGLSPEDAAAGVQAVTEQVVCGWAKHWSETEDVRHLCLAGGLFANVRLNQKVAEACAADDLFVFPHMGDGGLCVGAALAVSGIVGPASFPTPFLGPDPGRVDDSVSIPVGWGTSPLDETAVARIAETIAAGGVVGIVRGPMEFGPRALGNRSLLFSAADPAKAEAVNRALSRPAIMPYAPIAREEDYEQISSTRRLAVFRHMTATADALPGIAQRYPVAVHADGTMRIQLVSRAHSPLLHAILSELAKRESPPLLINTSFNLHTEPIVATAERALELLDSIPLDGLVLDETYIARKREDRAHG